MVTEEELSDMSQEEIAEMQKENCIFCKIVAGEVPSKKVFEDDVILAIMDIRPAAEGHVLVLPKEHYPVLPTIPQDVQRHMFERTKDLCQAMKDGLPAMGTTVFLANGAAAGQQSPHFIYHIIPREKGDGLDSFQVTGKGIDQSRLLEPLQKSMGQVMQQLLKQEGKMPGQGQAEAAKDQLAMILEQNPQIKQLLKEDPAKFKQLVQQNPQLQQFFQDVDIQKLSAKLNQVEGPGEERGDEAGDEDDGGDDSGGHEAEITDHTDDEGSGEADLDKISRLFK